MSAQTESGIADDPQPSETASAAEILNRPIDVADFTPADRFQKQALKQMGRGAFDANTVLARRRYAVSSDVCQVPGLPRSPVPIGLRLGAAISPRIKFAGGVDVTIPGLHFARGLSTRVDFDAIAAANFHGISTLFPLTFDQVYRISLPAGSGIYVGGGVGPYFGEVTRLGGKLLIGGSITPRFGLEGTVHFQGIGDSIATVQARTTF